MTKETLSELYQVDFKIMTIQPGLSPNYVGGEVSCLGTIKEAGLEAVMACGPDVIFIGGWLAGSYDALSQIAPVVYLATSWTVQLMLRLFRRKGEENHG